MTTQCSRCRSEAVIYQPYSGQHLCRDHFILDFEAKAKRVIRQHRWMQPGDRIAVALTGTSAGEALLHFFRKLAGRRRDVQLEGVRVSGTIPELAAWAKDSGFTRIAIAAPLENHAESILTGILRGRAEVLFAPSCEAVPVITPFCHIPAGEVEQYAEIQGIVRADAPPYQEEDPLFNDVKSLFEGYTEHHPGAPYAILNLKDALEIQERGNHSCNRP